MWFDALLEKNLLPDLLIRQGIRNLLKQRLQDESKGGTEFRQEALIQLIEELKNSPIAIETEAANEQHYEVPTEFFQLCLGKHLKYSSGLWLPGTKSLDDAESNMLELTCQRAELQNGQTVLELGCGWGSLSLFMAAKYPQSNFTVVSNSASQKIHIDHACKLRSIANLEVQTININDFKASQNYDRVVSVEMFEHMRNYRQLMALISEALKPDGKLFVHIFTHKEYAYKFEVKNESDWMSKYFFTGGIMPSDDLLLYFNDHLKVKKHWHVNGKHYSKTAEAWLENMDRNKKKVTKIFEKTYGHAHSIKWFVYWRIFYMACAELWAFNSGEEWMVSHYLFEKTNP